MEWILEQRKCNIKMREIYWMCVCIVDSLCYRRLSIIGTSSIMREKKTKIKTHTQFYIYDRINLLNLSVYNAY